MRIRKEVRLGNRIIMRECEFDGTQPTPWLFDWLDDVRMTGDEMPKEGNGQDEAAVHAFRRKMDVARWLRAFDTRGDDTQPPWDWTPGPEYMDHAVEIIGRVESEVPQ